MLASFAFILTSVHLQASAKMCTSDDGNFLINQGRLVGQSDRHSCPKGYHLAQLDDWMEWEKAVKFSTKFLGFNNAAWIARSLEFDGEGDEAWMLVTPAHSNGNQSKVSLPEIPPFIHSRRGKLAINFDANRKLVQLCAKNSSDQ